MSEKWIEVEGADLAQALEKACAELGLTRANMDYDFDLNHFKGGASTVRILAGGKDPQAVELSGELEERVKGLLEAQNLDAQVSVRVNIFAVQIELRAPAPGIADEPFRAFAGSLETDLAEDTGGRDIRVALRGFGAEERERSDGPRRDRRGRSDDRGRRSGNGGYRNRDRGRFDREHRSSRPRPDDREERDERLRGRARSAIKKVIDGDGPVTLDDLNSYERRLVHLVVREHDGVVSHSVGEGSHKEVLIDRSSPED